MLQVDEWLESAVCCRWMSGWSRPACSKSVHLVTPVQRSSAHGMICSKSVHLVSSAQRSCAHGMIGSGEKY